MQQSFEWVMACIKSCTNQFQLDSAYVLVTLFKNRYESDTDKHTELEQALISMQTFIEVEV